MTCFQVKQASNEEVQILKYTSIFSEDPSVSHTYQSQSLLTTKASAVPRRK